MTNDTIEIKIIGDIKENYNGCIDCKYIKLPTECCKLAGCIHAWHSMKDLYEKEKEDEEN